MVIAVAETAVAEIVAAAVAEIVMAAVAEIVGVAVAEIATAAVLDVETRFPRPRGWACDSSWNGSNCCPSLAAARSCQTGKVWGYWTPCF